MNWDTRPNFSKRYVGWWEWHVRIPSRATWGLLWDVARGRCPACGLKKPTHQMRCPR